MKRHYLLAALAAAFLATAAPVRAADTSAPKVTPAVGKPLAEAEKLLQATPPDYKTALDKIHEAQAVPNRSPIDDYDINLFLGQTAAALKDYATATTAFEAVAESPMLAQDDNKASMLQNAIILSTAASHYQKVIQYGNTLAAMGPLPYNIQERLAVAYYNTNDYARAKDYAEKGAAGAKAAGQQPEPAVLQIMVNSQIKSNNQSGAEATLEQLASQSGSPDVWGKLIDYMLTNSKPRDIDAINLMRLAAVTNADVEKLDWTLLASLSLRKGYPGEAMTAAKHGGKAPGAAAKAAADERDLPREEAVAKTKNGEFSVQLAEDFYGYGRYAEAETAARRAISMGGVKDPGEAHMVLGMALVGQGRYSDAVEAFQHVTSGAKTAHLWVIYAQSKSQPASAAAH